MATDLELTTLYANLRAAFLSRHFAIGRYFRTNYFSQQNRLATSLKASDVLQLSPDAQAPLRWDRSRDSDNPMLMGCMLMACLAAEDALGHPHAPRILHSAVATLRSLYKASGNHFDGYPLRWDPASSDRWQLQYGQPAVSDEFLIDDSGNYIYCSSATDPRHWPRRSRSTLVNLMGETEASRYTQADENQLGSERYDYFDRYRRAELSMDELCGLMASYFMTHKFCTTASTRSEVERQANNLGDFLAESGWLLIRPTGGFNMRGAAGILPALEFPMTRALLSITGNDYRSRTGFEGAMQRAGCWDCLAQSMAEWTTLGVVAGPIIAPMLMGVIAALGLFPFVPEVAPLAGIVLPAAGIPAAVLAASLPIASIPMARAYAVYDKRSCFDVKDDNSATELAAACFLMENVPLSVRFQGWMWGAGFTGKRDGAWAAAFPPYLALTAIDDPDTTLRDAYFGWLTERHKHPELEPLDHPAAEGCFASAVAVILGAGTAEETRLVGLLDAAWNVMVANAETQSMPPPSAWFNSDIPIADSTDKPSGNWLYTHEGLFPAMDFQAGLALAWLHAKRRADAGNPVATPGFPTPPNNFLAWPVPVVPPAVVKMAQDRQLALPVASINTPIPTVYSYGAELFATEDPPQKPDVAAPIVPPIPKRAIVDRTITVAQSDGDVFTGIVLNNGDDFAIVAAGSIWAADITHGTNGPNGWDGITWDESWPLFGALDPVNAHPNCLLGRLGGYFFVGESMPRRRFLYHQSCPLWLRINSKSPGGGSGSFQVRIFVWSNSLRAQLAMHGIAPASVGALAQELGQKWPRPPALSLGGLEDLLLMKN